MNAPIMNAPKIAPGGRPLRPGVAVWLAGSIGLDAYGAMAERLAWEVSEPDGRPPTLVLYDLAPSITIGRLGSRTDVEIADDAGVYFACAVIAGDGRIVIGPRTNVQDNCLFVTDAARGPLVLGAGVTIGHNVRMGAATIHDDALVGMGAQVGDGVVVLPGGCIGARSLVEPGTVVDAGWIWAGRPARASTKRQRPGARAEVRRRPSRQTSRPPRQWPSTRWGRRMSWAGSA